MSLSNELQTGKAGEYLVCVDLIEKGFIAYPSEQGLPYDVVIDTGNKLLKCQVKTTSSPRKIPQRKKDSFAWIFNVKRKGKGNKKIYSDGDVDLFALVGLSERVVGYLKPDDLPVTLNLRVDSLVGSYYDEKGAQDYIRVKRLKGLGLSQTQASKELGLAIATVNRMWQKNYKPFKSGARYFSDIFREKDWFYEV